MNYPNGNSLRVDRFQVVSLYRVIFFIGSQQYLYNSSQCRINQQYRIAEQQNMIDQARKQIEINPEYLVSIAKIVDILNIFYHQEKLTPLTSQFNDVLANSFGTLMECLSLYQNDPQMAQSSLLKCKITLEMFCWQKLHQLLQKQSQQLAKIIHILSKNNLEYANDFEKIILAERIAKTQDIDAERDRIIFNLRREVVVKRQYVHQLEDKIRDLQEQNSKLYSKLINNSKNIADFGFSSPSKRKIESSPNINKMKIQTSMNRSLTARQTEQIIQDIMESKLKQQSIKGNHHSINKYLKTYFRHKFGMKQLIEESEMNFREAVLHYSKSQQKPIFTLFQAIIDQECEEQYYNDYKALNQRLIKFMKRNLNENNRFSLPQLDKLFDSKSTDDKSDIFLSEEDVRGILNAIYKNIEVGSLGMILSELIQGNGKETVSAKKLLNQILHFQIKKHSLKIEDIVREIRREDSHRRGLLTYQNICNISIALKISDEKCELINKSIVAMQDKFFTFSQVIELIEKIRSLKLPKKKNDV